jgi:hypothetical protein
MVFPQREMCLPDARLIAARAARWCRHTISAIAVPTVGARLLTGDETRFVQGVSSWHFHCVRLQTNGCKQTREPVGSSSF